MDEQTLVRPPLRRNFPSRDVTTITVPSTLCAFLSLAKEALALFWVSQRTNSVRQRDDGSVDASVQVDVTGNGRTEPGGLARRPLTSKRLRDRPSSTRGTTTP